MGWHFSSSFLGPWNFKWQKSDRSSSSSEKNALYCGLWSSNAHYWKVSNSLKIILSGAGVFAMFGAIGFGYKRTGSVSEVGCTSVTVSFDTSVLVFPN